MNMSENIKIKQAGTCDAETVAALAREIWTEHYASIISAGQIEYMLERFQSAGAITRQIAEGGYKYFVAYDGEIPAAYCAFTKDAGGGLFLSKEYVKKELRGRGIARALIEYGAASYGLPDGTVVRLTVNKNNAGSIAAYRRLGFEITNEAVIKFDVQFFDDHTSPRSSSNTLIYGKDGTEAITEQIIHENGIFISRGEVRRVTIEEPVTEIIVRGTR